MIQLTLNILLQTMAVTANAHDYATAYQQTVETGRPLVVLVGADWCPACRQMKTGSIPELEKSGGLKKVAFAYVNTDHQGDLAGKLMTGGMIPQLVMYQKNAAGGWTRQQLNGAHSATDIEAFLNKATEAHVSEVSAAKLIRN